MTSAVELEESLRGQRIALEEIPLIDFGDFLTGDLAARQAVAEKVGHACRNIGFFYLTNHGVSDALLARTFAEAKRFFDQPLEKKLAADIEKSSCHRGYFKVGGENLDPEKQTADGDLKEGFKIGRNQVELNHPVKTIGLVNVALALHPEVEVTVTLNIARSADEAERQARGETLDSAEAIYGDDINDTARPDEFFDPEAEYEDLEEPSEEAAAEDAEETDENA